jgi:hypothetical protein
MRNPLRFLLLAAVALAGVSASLAQAASTACPPTNVTTYAGQCRRVGNGAARTWVSVDTATQAPVAVGVTLTEEALTGLPARPTEYVLSFPSQVNATPFRGLVLNWFPQGQCPRESYGAPHFTFNFFTVNEDTRQGVRSDNGRMPAAEYIPQGYTAVPGSFAPRLGVRWVNANAPELRSQVFTQTLSYTFANCRLMSVAPMASLCFLQGRPNLTACFAQPTQYLVSGYFPSTYTIQYDADRRNYTIALGGMVKH